MDFRNVVITVLLMFLTVSVGMGLKAERRAAYLEGQHDIFEWQSQAEEHVCGPYEQPTTEEKRAKKHVRS